MSWWCRRRNVVTRRRRRLVSLVLKQCAFAEYREKREKLVADKIQTLADDFKEKADICEQQDEKEEDGYFPCTRTVETHMDEDGRKITATVKIERNRNSRTNSRRTWRMVRHADKTIDFFNKGIPLV